jgi:uroporphyrinogen-III synthase
MRVLLTRALENSLTTAEILKARNISAAIAPMFTIMDNPAPVPPTDQYQALIATSQHAIKAWAKLSTDREIPVYCVGDHTAAMAAENGFANVHSADGSSVELFRLIQKNLPAQKAPLLRLSGYNGDDELVAKLQKAKFTVDAHLVYYLQPTLEFSDETAALIHDGKIDGVLFYSPKTAARFCTLLIKYDLTGYCRRLTAWCISDATARALGNMEFRLISIAAKPNENDLLKLIF